MKPQDVSRQTHAQESHDDGRNGTMSYVTGRGNSGLRISFFPSREWSLWGGGDAKAPGFAGGWLLLDLEMHFAPALPGSSLIGGGLGRQRRHLRELASRVTINHEGSAGKAIQAWAARDGDRIDACRADAASARAA